MRRSSLQQYADGAVGHQDDRPANRLLTRSPNDGTAAEMTTNPPTAAPATHSAAAERMRRHRERRRDGLRCVVLELRVTEIDALVRNGFLKADARNDPYTIEVALYDFLERSLV
jgi:hypothetical protein